LSVLFRDNATKSGAVHHKKVLFGVALQTGGKVEGARVVLGHLDPFGPREWARGPARVVGGEVVLEEDRAEKYFLDTPEANERMAFALATLSFVGQKLAPEGVIAFVKRYGLLWHGTPGSGQCREALDDWATAVLQLWFAGTLYLKLMNSVREGTATEVRDFMRKFGRYFPQATEEEYTLHASVFLQTMINSGLWGTPDRMCVWGLVLEGPGKLTLGYFPPDLLSAAYASFAHLMTNRFEIKECPGCGRLFRPEHGGQKWCARGCGSTYRARRRRERLANN
jgi:hypothetical protein